MIELQVPDMTCGHCAGRVTKAVKAIDDTATVDVDLASKQVRIGSTHGAAEFSAAIREAGYTPQPA